MSFAESLPSGTLGAFFQTAYVTTDLERAADLLGKSFDIPEFYIGGIHELPRVDAGAAKIRSAIAWVGATQLEIIQPCGGQDQAYREFLPSDGFGVRHHHFCGRIFTRHGFDEAEAEFAARGFPIVMRMVTDRLCAFYADTRTILGHYLEYVWIADDEMLTMGGKIPVYGDNFIPRATAMENV